MRRFRRVFTEAIGIATGCGVIAVVGLASLSTTGPAIARTTPTCGSLRGRTIAQDRRFRVVSKHAHDLQLFACAYRTRKVRQVYPADGDDGGLCGTFSLVRLAASVIAVAFDSCGGGGSYYREFIVVRDVGTIRTVRRLHSAIDEAVRTTDLVVKRDGAVGWIWEDCGPIDFPRGDCSYAVDKLDGTRRRQLDSGDIDPQSLTLHGSRMSWTKGSIRRSARLH